ncbi:hypothetical protein QR680_000220 [Steinernema hermaphroditum]|uniref:Uncharacterized protein n=1 Tax=Steinernema hermaphroditum TaxID=289476 RepID=A0AA39LDT0_9BILA|nr:hypothetical protein QR680_000220 [Steinernema hermaphroditum]
MTTANETYNGETAHRCAHLQTIAVEDYEQFLQYLNGPHLQFSLTKKENYEKENYEREKHWYPHHGQVPTPAHHLNLKIMSIAIKVLQVWMGRSRIYDLEDPIEYAFYVSIARIVKF